MAESGRYPAIDLEASVSRLLPNLTDPRERALIGRFRKLTSVYQRNRDLISLGMYRAGNDPEALGGVLGELAPLLRDTLVGFAYIYYSPPGAWRDCVSE